MLTRGDLNSGPVSSRSRPACKSHPNRHSGGYKWSILQLDGGEVELLITICAIVPDYRLIPNKVTLCRSFATVSMVLDTCSQVGSACLGLRQSIVYMWQVLPAVQCEHVCRCHRDRTQVEGDTDTMFRRGR